MQPPRPKLLIFYATFQQQWLMAREKKQKQYYWAKSLILSALSERPNCLIICTNVHITYNKNYHTSLTYCYRVSMQLANTPNQFNSVNSYSHIDKESLYLNQACTYKERLTFSYIITFAQKGSLLLPEWNKLSSSFWIHSYCKIIYIIPKIWFYQSDLL